MLVLTLLLQNLAEGFSAGALFQVTLVVRVKGDATSHQVLLENPNFLENLNGLAKEQKAAFVVEISLKQRGDHVEEKQVQQLLLPMVSEFLVEIDSDFLVHRGQDFEDEVLVCQGAESFQLPEETPQEDIEFHLRLSAQFPAFQKDLQQVSDYVDHHLAILNVVFNQ